ncbi:MAG: LCP family protein [Candidatus Moranbacteria bacterium]|nr:LCP family protein [Candidatus Moranbacteria bacterium]
MDDFKKNTPPRAPQPFILSQEKGSFEDSGVLPGSRPITRAPQKNRSLWRFSLSLIATGLLIISGILFFIYQGVSLGENMQFENTARQSFVTSLQKLTHNFFSSQPDLLQGEEQGRINILLLGRAGERYPGKNLTDTVMIMSIDTSAKKVALLSLPRDLYVPIGDTELYTKLNAVYQYGLSTKENVAPLRKTIETITGIPIHYFVTVDFDGFEKIVDTLDGINIEVPRDFYDPRYPGKNYSYETFELKKGWQILDGATALKYVRERHDDPAGDFGRAKRQQQVIQALKDKAFSLGTLFNIVTLNQLLHELGESVKTDMAVEDMGRFLELSRSLDTKNVTTVVIDAWKKESLLRVSHLQVGPIAAFILVPRTGNWNELRDVSTSIFNRNEQVGRKQAILQEKPSVALYYYKNDFEAQRRLTTILRDELGFDNILPFSLSAFPNQPEKSIIVERTPLAKPFSIDELLKKFSFERMSTLPFTPRETTADFSIVLGTDLATALSLDEGDTLLNSLEDTSFSEPLPPQPLK